MGEADVDIAAADATDAAVSDATKQASTDASKETVENEVSPELVTDGPVDGSDKLSENLVSKEGVTDKDAAKDDLTQNGCPLEIRGRRLWRAFSMQKKAPSKRKKDASGAKLKGAKSPCDKKTIKYGTNTVFEDTF